MKRPKPRYKFPLIIRPLPVWKGPKSDAEIAAAIAGHDAEAAIAVPPARAAGRYPDSVVAMLVRDELDRGWGGGGHWKAGASMQRIRLGLFEAGELQGPDDRSMDDTIRKTRQREVKARWAKHEDRRD